MTNNNSIEILLPGGSYESVTAAVRQGADAVYIGSLRFSARAYAANFDGGSLREIIAYCHLHGVKVHITLNTLISDEEMPLAVKTAKDAYLAGADAIIIQDWGLASIVKKACPDIALHASTQMSVHTPHGAKLLYENGFDRVVLAREMNRDEIAAVVNACPIETEVFVHGALCMCISGQCYLSAMIGGRSGNRGRCAQPCRLPFKVRGGTGYDLSLKDNCVLNELSELADIGVTSAKIEGRMKRPEYAAAAAAAARHSADKGKADEKELERLKAVFSRSGFTSGYYYGRLGRDMFGTRSKEDVVSATEKVLSEIRAEYKDEVQTNAVSFTLVISEGSPAVLTAQCGELTVCVSGAIPEPARNVPLSEDKAKQQLAKTGGTAFYADSISAVIDEGLTIPLSAINTMRREALSKLEAIITAVPERRYTEPAFNAVTPHKRHGQMKYRAYFHSCDIHDVFKQCEYVFVPLFSPTEGIKTLMERGFAVGIELPRAIFGQEEKTERRLKELKAIGITDVSCGNIGTAALAAKLGFKVHGGFGLNIFNSYSIDFCKSIGIEDAEVSFELTAGQINKLGGNCGIGAVGYGYLPLMITRNCPNKNGSGCKKCGGRSSITDRKGNVFPLMCTAGCTELLNCTPLILSDKQEQFGNIDFMSLRFTIESRDECEKIFSDYLNKRKPVGKYTRGLYFRGVE